MFFARSRRSNERSGPRGRRAYIVGDVHGRDDLLDALLARIEADLDSPVSRKALLIFVGDLIDRGPGSAQVIERLRTYRHPHIETVFLLGNHEEVLLRVLAGERGILDSWRNFGGTECMASYGIDPDVFAEMEEGEAIALVRATVPSSHAEFLAAFADTCRFGDYLVVHAGIRPGVELERQSQSDLRWIRQPFLHDTTDHGFTVVHGHTIVPDVEEHRNRIAIDTGAYRSGRLTALVIEGAERRYLTATAEETAGVA